MFFLQLDEQKKREQSAMCNKRLSVYFQDLKMPAVGILYQVCMCSVDRWRLMCDALMYPCDVRARMTLDDFLPS